MLTAYLPIQSAKVDFLLIQQSTQFRALSDENQQIVSALLHVQDNLVTDLRSQVTALSLLLSRAEARTSEFIAVDTAPDPTVGYTGGTERQLRQGVTKELLSMLAFESIRDRFEGIDEAHKNTFGWIFRPLTQHQAVDESEPQPPANSSFVTWLAGQSGIYWINGKAASGKSTLMKYILAHPDMPRHLRRWAASGDPAGSRSPRFASFFFWASGTKEQRSQSGLLRSILYEVLIQEPKLVPLAFPAQWSSLYSRSLGSEQRGQHRRPPGKTESATQRSGVLIQAHDPARR
jgi:hypothetical protein